MATLKLVLLGPPGGGKGTQAKMLSEKYGLPHISTGDIFRRAIADSTPLGTEAKRYMDSGQLVPDEVVIGLVKERLSQDDCAAGYLLDGFPRTLPQAEALSGFEALDAALYIEVPESELLARLTGRRSCKECNAVYHIMYNKPKVQGKCDKCGGQLYQRDDDTEATVRNRLAVYNEQTKPLVEFYKGADKLITIDGDADIQAIFKEMCQVLERLKDA